MDKVQLRKQLCISEKHGLEKIAMSGLATNLGLIATKSGRNQRAESMPAKIAILTSSVDGSPKVLAQGLVHMLSKLEVSSRIYYDTHALLRRLLPLYRRPRRWYLRLHSRLQQKFAHCKEDRQLLKELGTYSAVVFCYVVPNALWRNYFDIESLRKRLTGIPILLYAVMYVGNAPRHQKDLLEGGDFGIERYDWHLSVSEVTETRGEPGPTWSAIGFDLEHTALRVAPKKEFVVVVDFAQPGYERYRQEQLAVLRDLGIAPIVLEGRYPMAEIRQIYQEASILFIQSFETFGLPIAECLYTGARVFTPHSGWPMAFRLDPDPQPYGPGTLPEVFHVYDGAEDLRQQLIDLHEAYDPERDPYRVSKVFRDTYPTFGAGDLQALHDVVERIERGELVGRRARRWGRTAR